MNTYNVFDCLATPGLLKQEYELRRARLAAKLPNDSIAIIAGHGLRYKSNNIFYKFHQNTDLSYLTGFNEPDAICVIQKNTTLDRCYTFKLFLQPKTKSLEIWDGPRSGTQGAIDFFNADSAAPISDFPAFLSDQLINNTSHTQIYSNVSTIKDFDATRINFHTKALTTNPDAALFSTKYVSSKKHTVFHLNSLRGIIDSIRSVKSSAEVALMQTAGDLSGKAFIDVLGMLKPGVSEHDISATLEYGIKIRGGDGFAYEPVVAGGKRALILHYTLNQQLVHDGDLVLIDAGGEYGNYSSDITRTFPVSGKFTQAQREIYEAVLSANMECIEMCRSDRHVSLDNLHRLSSILLRSKIEALFERIVTPREWDLIYPHFVGHYLGMDVHDCASLSRGAVLIAGNVITIEPGIYIPDSEEYPERYRGIGIRIEDDVVIGDCCEATVLTSGAPKTVNDIERTMQETARV